MIFIAHRGNISGPNQQEENTVKYLKKALSMGLGIECDVMTDKHDNLCFGHDQPQEPIDFELLKQPNVFVHCKDILSFETLLKKGVHVFMHEEDPLTLTSRGFVWAYPGIQPHLENAVWLDLDPFRVHTDRPSPNIYGICGDYLTVVNSFK